MPDHYAFITVIFLGLVLFPLAVLVGLSVGALLGATIGSGTVGLVRSILVGRKPPGTEEG